MAASVSDAMKLVAVARSESSAVVVAVSLVAAVALESLMAWSRLPCAASDT